MNSSFVNKTDKLIENSKNVHTVMNSVCNVLKPLINIEQFSFYHVKADGSAIIINSDLRHLKYYIDKKHYILDPHIVNPKNMDSGIRLWVNYRDKNFHGEYLLDLKSMFHLDHGISYIQKNDQEYKAYTFATNSSNYYIYNQYVNYAEYLNFFANYVDSKLLSLDDIEEYYVDMQEIKGEQFNVQKGITVTDNVV